MVLILNSLNMDYSQKDYSPFDHGTCTKEPNDPFFLTEEQKKERWEKFQDTELDNLTGRDNAPL